MRPRFSKLDIRKVISPITFLIGGGLLWEAVVRLGNIPAYILPAPSVILQTMAAEPLKLLRHTGVTALEAFAGFLLASGVAFVVAVGFAHSKVIQRGLYPYAVALKTTPIVALAPLLVIWFGTGVFSKVVCSALICFFPVLVNATKGLTGVDEDALNLFDSLAASKWKKFRLLRLPNSLPYLFSALKVSSSLSVVGAVVGEFVGANVGLGYWILISSYHLETPAMFGAVFATAGIGLVFFGLVNLGEFAFVKSRKEEALND